MGLSAVAANTNCLSQCTSPTSFPDRLGELWWVALEAVIAQNDRIGMVINGKEQYFECATVKREARAL